MDDTVVREIIDIKGQVVAKLERVTPEGKSLFMPTSQGKFFLDENRRILFNEKGEEVFSGHCFPTPVGTSGYFVARGEDLEDRNEYGIFEADLSIFKGERVIVAKGFRSPARLDLYGKSLFTSALENALVGSYPYPHRIEAGVGYVQLPKLESE